MSFTKILSKNSLRYSSELPLHAFDLFSYCSSLPLCSADCPRWIQNSSLVLLSYVICHSLIFVIIALVVTIEVVDKFRVIEFFKLFKSLVHVVQAGELKLLQLRAHVDF